LSSHDLLRFNSAQFWTPLIESTAVCGKLKPYLMLICGKQMFPVNITPPLTVKKFEYADYAGVND
jgi:hypothetical protein